MFNKIIWGIAIIGVILLGSTAASVAQEKAPPPAPKAAAPSPSPAPAPAVSAPQPPAPPEAKPAAPVPDAKEILRLMCDFLKNQQQFSFKAEVTDDRIFYGGRKLQYGLDMEGFFRRPDRFRINGEGDLENKQLYFDGKTFTLYDKNLNHYGVLEIAGDMDAALDKAGKDYGVRVGLAELGSAHLGEYANRELTNALYVGLSKVRGIPCHHLAFDKKDVHFQLWIEAGDQPLLRKVVVTQKRLPYAPQWTAYLSDWNFSPQLTDNLFTFVPPAGAQKINFIPVKKAEPPAPKKAKPKKGKPKKKGDDS